MFGQTVVKTADQSSSQICFDRNPHFSVKDRKKTENIEMKEPRNSKIILPQKHLNIKKVNASFDR